MMSMTSTIIISIPLWAIAIMLVQIESILSEWKESDNG